MKNKKIVLFLIIFLIVLIICLLILMFKLLTKQLNFINYKTSNELIFDKKYNIDFIELNINTSTSKIYIKKSENTETRVIIYGKKNKSKVLVDNNSLNIKYIDKCNGLCLYKKIAKIEVLLPEKYSKKINITNQFGDVNIKSFPNASISVQENFGNIKIDSGKSVSASNNFGNISLGTVNNANVKNNCGDIKIEKVNEVIAKNDYGNIVVDTVNDYLDLANNCGDIKVNNANITKNSVINNNLGTIGVNETNKIFINAKTKMGKVKIKNNYQNSEITLKIENDLGDIKINN